MSDHDFCITKKAGKGWWVVTCGTCGAEETRFSFASCAAFIFKHLHHAPPAESTNEGGDDGD